jgi:predicted aspartyl protease
MGTFHTKCMIQHVVDRRKKTVVPRLLVDTGSEYTWIPSATLERLGIEREKKDVPFVMANGQQVTRSVGFAIVHIGQFFTIDEIVFAEKGDLSLLGARTLEGLNLAPIRGANGSLRPDRRPRHSARSHRSLFD